MDYGALIGLSTGAFVAFGLFSLPMGWLSERAGRRNLLAAFFVGCGCACLGISTATTQIGFAVWLFVLGVFCGDLPSDRRGDAGDPCPTARARPWLATGSGAISAPRRPRASPPSSRHRSAGRPPSSCPAWSVSPPERRSLRSSPATVSEAAQRKDGRRASRCHARCCCARLRLAVVAGGMTFNITTIALPKVIDERLGLALRWPCRLARHRRLRLRSADPARWLAAWSTGSVRRDLRGLSHASAARPGVGGHDHGLPLLDGLVLVMAAIYGQVVVNDAMVARYVPAEYRAKAFRLRYFLGFTTSGLAVPLIGLLHGRAASRWCWRRRRRSARRSSSARWGSF